MKLRKWIIALSVLLAGHAYAAEEISFSGDVLPGLIEQCSICHQRYDRHGYLVIDAENTYQAIVGIPSYQLPSMNRVEPGDPDRSYLWLKATNQHVEAGGKGWQMPVMIGVRGPLRDTLYQWIAQGAKNN